MPMNLRASRPGAGRAEGVDDDIDRIVEIWEVCRRDFGGKGGLLFGEFTIADAFYAPVVGRFRSYGVNPGGAAEAYMNAVWALPAMTVWVEKARAETWSIERYEI
jgi:glutathione S-transferase